MQQGFKVFKDRLVRKVHRGSRATPVQSGCKGCQEQPAPRVRPALSDRVAPSDRLVLSEHPALSEQLARLGPMVLPALLVL